MSLVATLVETVLLLIASAGTVVAVVGIAASRDVYAQLVFGSIASGGALAALVGAVLIEQGLSIVTVQCVTLLLLMVPSSAIATHRIAARVHDRQRPASAPASAAEP